MKLTKEQKADLIRKLGSPLGLVYLQCDSDKVALYVLQGKGLKFFVAMYVNGKFNSAWMDPANSVPEQRYLRKTVRPLYSARDKARAEKECGKRYVKKHMSGTYTLYRADWPSGKAAINHLCKVCESIEILDEIELIKAAKSEKPPVVTVEA